MPEPDGDRAAMAPWNQKPDDRYIVIARDDNYVYRLLTRRVFETHAGAKHYANGVSPSREPMIVACGANTVILRKELL